MSEWKVLKKERRKADLLKKWKLSQWLILYANISVLIRASIVLPMWQAGLPEKRCLS